MGVYKWVNFDRLFAVAKIKFNQPINRDNRTAVGVSRAVAVALWCWYVLIVRCAALEARVVGGL